MSFLSNESLYGNWAVYSNPTVQGCIDAFTSTSNVITIASLCRQAQGQIYNDAPYAWLGIAKLWYAGGSLVWLTGVVKGFYVEQLWAGESTAPILGTVTFG